MKADCVRQHAPHPKCRPGKTSPGTKAIQLRANGRWGKDNGDPGLAFVGLAVDATDAVSATVWVANCACKVYRKCPVSRALAFATDNGYAAVTVERRRQARGSRGVGTAAELRGARRARRLARPLATARRSRRRAL